MIQGTFNYHGYPGMVVKDPTWTITYRGQTFGGTGQCGPLELEWVYYHVDHVPFGDVPERMAEDGPTMLFESADKAVSVQYDRDAWVYA